MSKLEEEGANPRRDGEAVRSFAPWESDETESPPSERARHDAFTASRKKQFLEVLSKTACILDACRALGVSSSTVYNHQRSDPEFLHHCELALHMASTTAEIMAWERGVVGIEEEVVRYNKVVTVRKRSDSILRLLLQGSNRKKYGPRPGFSRKRMLKHERKQMEREIRDSLKTAEPSIEEVREEIVQRVQAMRRHKEKQRLQEGWIRAEDGYMIPPGWVRADASGAPPGQPGGDGEAEKFGGSM